MTKTVYKRSLRYKILDLDTKILGLKTAKILSIKSKNSVRKLIDSLKKEKIEYATFRVNAKDLPLIHALEKMGFQVVDGYLSLVKDLKEAIQKDFGIKIREGDSDDIEILQESIAPTFIYSRFFNDPLIKKEAAINMHKIWIENCIKGKAAQKVYVAEIDGKPIGFIALEMKEKEGYISLIGVNPKYRGRKISQALTLYAIENFFLKKGAKFIRIETQITNIPATRAYENLGFKLVDSAITLRWSQKS